MRIVARSEEVRALPVQRGQGAGRPAPSPRQLLFERPKRALEQRGGDRIGVAYPGARGRQGLPVAHRHREQPVQPGELGPPLCTQAGTFGCKHRRGPLSRGALRSHRPEPRADYRQAITLQRVCCRAARILLRHYERRVPCTPGRPSIGQEPLMHRGQLYPRARP